MRARYLIEAFVLAIVPFALNLLATDDPGLVHSAVNPYLIVAFAVAAFRGLAPGYVTLAAGTSLAYLWFGILVNHSDLLLFTAEWSVLDPLELPRIGTLTLSGVFGVLLFGLIHLALARRIRHLKQVTADLGQERDVVDRQRGALLAATSELERHVSGQRDSVAYLYSRWRELSSKNLTDALRMILDTAAELTGSTRCSLWQLDSTASELIVRTTSGWDTEDLAERRLPVNGSIEGWVLRNDRLFTAKDLTRYDTLRRIDRGAVVYSAPLRAGSRAWGVIDIEDLPFERFTAHTEHMLLLLTEIAATPLQQAITYESDLEPPNRSVDTGYPLFEQMTRMLRTEADERTANEESLSVVLIQMGNYHQLMMTVGLDRTDDIIRRVFHAITHLSPGFVSCFHYKNEAQLAVVCPGLDFDGAAILALDFLRWSAEASWPDDLVESRPEFTVGYSSLAPGVNDTEELLLMAENLLSMQNR